MLTRSALLVFVGTLALTASSVRAEPNGDAGRWVPVIVDSGSGEQTLAVVNAVGTVLRTVEGVDLMDPAEAARAFESAHSAEPVLVPDDELRAVGDGFKQALDAAALGNWDEASRLVRGFEDRSQPVQDYVSFRLDLSRDLFDYCLMSVQFILRAGRDNAARERMQACVYEAPYRTLSANDTPQALLELFASVKSELLAKGEASLDVDAAGLPTEDVASASKGCVVVVNGTPKGGLPYREAGLLPVPLRVQLNCAGHGRTHVVKLRPGRNSLIVDLRLERVVRTSGALGLHYADAKEESRARVRDGLSVTRAVGGGDVLLARTLEGGRISLARYELGLEKLVAEVTLPARPTAEEIRVAAHALVAGRPGATVVVDRRPGVSVDTDGTAAPGYELYAAAVLGVGTAASYGLSWLSYVRTVERRSDVVLAGGCAGTPEPDLVCLQAFGQHQTFGDYTLAFGGVGAVLGAAAMPVILPPEHDVPLWSWIVGVAGAGAVTAGAVLWRTAEPCTLQRCDAEHLDPSLGQLLILHGPPLLAVPITHLVRSLTGTQSVEARLVTGQRSARLTLQGQF